MIGLPINEGSHIDSTDTKNASKSKCAIWDWDSAIPARLDQVK